MQLNFNFFTKIFLSILIGAFLSFSLIWFFIPLNGKFIIPYLIALVSLSYILYLVLSDNFANNFFQLNKEKKMVTFIFIIIFSVIFLASCKGNHLFLKDNLFIIQLFVYIGAFLTACLITLFIVMLSLKLEFAQKSMKVKVSKWNILLYALPCLLVSLVFLIAFFPGNMTNDSLTQWGQTKTHNFNNWQPVVYTWLIMALTNIWGTPAIVALFQIIVMSLMIGYSLYRMKLVGVSGWILWLSSIGFALLPVNGMYAITLWKDILFSCFLVLFCVFIFNIITSNGQWIKKPLHLGLLILSAIGISLFRNNGFPVALLSIIFLLFIYKKEYKKYLLSLLLIVVVYFTFTIPIYNYFSVTPADPNEALSIPTQQIATIIVEDGEITPSQRNYLNRILPIKLWKEEFNPYITNGIKFSKEYNENVIFSDPKKFIKIWAELCLANPQQALTGFLKESSIVWKINYPDNAYFFGYWIGIKHPNQFGLDNYEINGSITDMVTGYLAFTFENLRNVLWRPAFFTYLSILFVFVAYLRNNKKIGLFLLPILLNTATLMVGAPAQDVRYLYSNIMIFFIAFIVMFINYKKRHLKYE